MEEIFWSKALIQIFVNRWRGHALFETLVPKVVDRWHGDSLFCSVPGIKNRWRWHAFSATETNAISLNNVNNPKFLIQVPEVGTDGPAIQFPPPSYI